MPNYSFNHDLELDGGKVLHLCLNIGVSEGKLCIDASASNKSSPDSCRSVEEEIDDVDLFGRDENDGFVEEKPDILKESPKQEEEPVVDPEPVNKDDDEDWRVTALFKKEKLTYQKEILSAIRLERKYYKEKRLTKEQEFKECATRIDHWKRVIAELPAWIAAMHTHTSQAALTFFISKNIDKHPLLVRCMANDTLFIGKLLKIGKENMDDKGKMRSQKARLAYYIAFEYCINEYASAHGIPIIENT
jgi:hypothetical protein